MSQQNSDLFWDILQNIKIDPKDTKICFSVNEVLQAIETSYNLGRENKQTEDLYLKTLAADFLNIASERFSNHSCNDVPESFYKNWSKDQRLQFVKNYYVWNKSPKEFSEDNLNLPDYALMDYLADILKNG